jgi:translocon-associated protein subunit alpha
MNLFIALLALVACAALAQKEEDPKQFKHPLTDMPVHAEDVETSPYFPQHTDHKLPVGETVTALCHFSNEGAGSYNVTAVMGSLNSPFDFRHHFQNYSYKTFGTLVKAGEEMSFKYNFQLHSDLEPVDYQLAVTVFYQSDKQSFSTTFFNQVSTVENSREQ